MESYEVGGGAANGLPAAGLVPGVVPSGPVLDHSAQKDRRLLAQQGSLGKRRKPSRGSLHAFLSALHRWAPGDSDEATSEAATAVTADAGASAPLPAGHSAPSGRPSARSSPPPLTTDIDNVNEADTKPKPYRTNQQQAEINNNKNIADKNTVQSETSKPGVRFIADSERPASAGGHLEVSKKSEVVRPGVGGTILGHRRQSSLDSGCSLDMSSSSSSSGKGSPDPVAPTLTPPPEFADTPIMERRRRSRRRHTSGASATGATPGTITGSPGVGTYSAAPKVPDSIPRIPRAKETSASTAPEPSSPEIHINFRILPRAKARGATNASGPSVFRSESCRPFSSQSAGGDASPPAFKCMSWDRHLLSSPSDRYLDDSERRCRSLSRPGRLPLSSHEEGSKRDPEWLEIARRRQATGVDWDNLETHMKQPQSISCSNLSESHMRGKVSTLASADRAGLRLVRSASALYPRIKMSRFERRMRRENPNPSPERRRSSDEFVLVSSSSSSSDAASAGASSTEDEKPSFLNVQLRHVEKAPPLNVVFQTRGGGGVGVGAVEPAPAPRSASPTLTWKSHREDNVAATTPSPTRPDRHSAASARSERAATAAAGRTRTVSESLGVAEYLTPKRVELIEAPQPAAKKDAGGHARGSPTRTALSDHIPRGGVRGGPPLRRSSSVQMRSREAMSAGRASPWDTMDSAVTPSWILEAERKKKSGIDWARLDKSLSQSGGKRATNLSSECLHQPTSATEVVPDWLKEIRRKKQEDASIRLSRSSDDLPCAVLLESLGGGGCPRAPSSRRDDSVDWPENLSALLDEIFSEAEESCTTPFPALLPSCEPAVAVEAQQQQQQQQQQEDERGDAEIYVNVPLRVARPVEDKDAEEVDREEGASKSPVEVAECSETTNLQTVDGVSQATTATAATTTSSSVAAAVAAVHAANMHSPKQALMEELKHVLQKRYTMEVLREDILNEANVIDSATPRPQSRSPTEASRKTPPTAAQRSTEQQPSSTAISGGSSIPPPPPLPPSDFWSKPKEVWFKQELQKPGDGRLVAPVCQRDSETQTHTVDYGAQVASPVQAFSPGSMLHAMTPFATYTRPFVAPGGNQVLLLDDRGIQLQSGSLYAMPIYAGTTPTSDRAIPLPPTPAAAAATGVFPATPAIFVARDDDRITKKVTMESKSTSTDAYFGPTPSPASAAYGTMAGGDTKSLLDEVEKKLEEDRKPPDESRPRTATPTAGGVSKITTVETTTIMETLQSTTVSRRAIDEQSLKSVCARSEKEDVLSGLSESPIPFADDDDVMEELGFSSRVESRSASRAEDKTEVVSDEKVTMYSSSRKHSVPQTEPKEPIQLRDVKSPPFSKQVNGEQTTPKAASPLRVSSPPRDYTPPRAVTPPDSSTKGPMLNGHRSPPRSPPLETSFDAVDRGFHTEPLKKRAPNGVTVLSSSKGASVTSKFQRPSCISPASSTVTTGPDGTLRGAHARAAAQTLAAATKEYCNGDVRRPLGPFKATKSMSDSNLGARMRPTKKPTASQATQTPNGVIPTFERRGESGFGGRAMGVQTDERIESFLRDTLRSSTKEVEFVTKVDSSQPSKTLRKKVTTKILRGTSGKAGGVREIIEEIYDQSSVVVRPSTAIKNVTRSVQQTSDGQKYLTTVITEAPPTGRSRRSRRRGFGDPDTHIIMV
ncbi:serine/arginine repetitive matrix protein 2 isoform X2 [Dermacentor silvarum]|nr:serine/arginine repetitive matrix protein 2 isoform X2 [Dermacentor silvarum]XP_049520081.1 serine/arginine repetitive matrix protein 2 isoform X2 [Dermacentor silvarum]